MGRILSKIILRLFGWKYLGTAPNEKKYVVIPVPHTSMMDFVWGKLAFASQNVNPVIFIKKEAFKFPMGILLRWLGAMPVDRGRGATGLVEQVIHHFDTNDNFKVCITPEGTREFTKKWKKGFYFIAQKANVPIYLGIIDYRKKICTMGERFVPSGDLEKDMAYINQYYRRINSLPKYPDKFSFDFS